MPRRYPDGAAARTARTAWLALLKFGVAVLLAGLMVTTVATRITGSDAPPAAVPVRAGLVVDQSAPQGGSLRLSGPGRTAPEFPRSRWQSGFIRPVTGKINSGFGPRDGGMHTGVDIDADTGTAVQAAGGGRVVLAETHFGYGETVVIAHGHGLSTLYGHLSSSKVKPGDRVAQGEVLGRSGCSGACTGDHLHFEIRFGGKPVNPTPYLPSKQPAPRTKIPLDPGYALVTVSP